jgi:plastocyanin
MRHLTLLRPTLASLALAAALGCGGGGGASGPSTGTPPPPPPAPGTPNSIVVTNDTFTPATLATAKGTAVTWTWNSCSGGDGYGTGQTCVAHNVVFDDGATGSGAQSSGTFTRTFAAAGTYPYHCSIHGSAMSGQVVVQ